MKKRNTLWIAVLLLIAALSACAPAAAPTATPTAAPTATLPAPAPTIAPTPTPAPFPLTATDSAGRSVIIGKAPQKLVSLAPSTTEVLFAIGQGSKVVAVDDFSDFPAEAKSLPKIGGFKLNFEQIVALNPDLVLAAGTTSPDNVKTLAELKLAVVVVGSAKTTMATVMSDIALVGRVMGVGERAQVVIRGMQRKLDDLKAKVDTAKTKPKVFWELDATDPSKPYTVGPGNFIHDIITLAGGENVFAGANSPFPQVGSEQVVAANPDVIILSDFAYGITVESVKARKGWDAIAAVKNGKIFPIDDNLVSRPGPRVVDGLEAAMKIIHPELFQ